MSKVSVKHTIYTMKYQYPGTTLYFYQQTVGTMNRETGQQTVTRTVYEILHAIVLPRELYNNLTVRDIVIQTKFEVNDIELMIDMDDVDFDITQIDYVVFDGKRYNIHRMFDIEKQALYLHLRETQNQQPYQSVTETVRQTLSLVQTVTGEVV